MPLRELIAALSGDDWSGVKAIMERIERARLWPQAVDAVVKFDLVPSKAIAEAFHTYWTEIGFRVREAVSNDPLMLNALRLLLPPYHGPGLTLYRGENLDRWQQGRLGFGWTPRREVATMFASGLAASEGTGGILVCANVPCNAIIASPGKHSRYLDEDEYIVDPRHLGTIQALEQFPRIH